MSGLVHLSAALGRPARQRAELPRRRAAGSLWSHDARRLSTHGLLFVTEGHGRFAGSPYDHPVKITAPAVVWLFPGIEHRYDATGGGWREQWLLFEGTAVRSYESLRAWQRSKPVLAAQPGLAEAIGPLFAALHEATTVPGRRAELLASTVTDADRHRRGDD